MPSDTPSTEEAKAAAGRLTASAVKKALAGDTEGARETAEKAKLANRLLTGGGADD